MSNEKNEIQERDALLKQAFDVIMKLDDEKLKVLLERMGDSGQ